MQYVLRSPNKKGNCLMKHGRTRPLSSTPKGYKAAIYRESKLTLFPLFMREAGRDGTQGSCSNYAIQGHNPTSLCPTCPGNPVS
ncbi:hypothetical protein TNCV_4245971 [Trichonephila clavipes]|nr:hypothetical protein TNCV_4245971 [Trichonephila clavipes]